LVGSIVGSFTLIGLLVCLALAWRRRRRHAPSLSDHIDPEAAQVETMQASERSDTSTMRSPRSLSVINVPAAQSLGPYGPYTGRAVSPGSTAAQSRPSTSNSLKQQGPSLGQQPLRLVQ
jgi:hypothetical protein